MQTRIVICDRCKDERRLGSVGTSPIIPPIEYRAFDRGPAKKADLCGACYDDFLKFVQNKSIEGRHADADV